MSYTIGLDLGGTNSVFGIVDEKGNIVEQTAIKTAGYSDAKEYVDAAMTVLLPLINKIGGNKHIVGMGIGAPNGNIITGSIEYAANIAWAHECIVPLAEMFGYATSLRSNSQGRGTFTMFMDHYEEVPKSISEEIIKKNGIN